MNRSWIVAAKLGGKYCGVDPNRKGVVYHDRTAVGGWERGELTLHDNGWYSFRFTDANVLLCINPSGGLETRSADAWGSWESHLATEQPHGAAWMFRPGDDGLPIGGLLFSLEAA